MNHSSTDIAVHSIPLTIQAEDAAPGFFSDLVMLTKARLTSLVLVTTFVGFSMASGDNLDWLRLLCTLLGTALVAGGSQTLNQVIETEVDRLMERTKDRPLPGGRIKRQHAMLMGIGMALTGIGFLGFTVNLVTAYLAAATLFVYLALYTPLKRHSPICISVGAIAGAIPPVLGWTAARPHFEVGTLILFGVLFLWQMPHFLAIAWMYRDEYAQAGFVMLRRRDHTGFLTALESIIFTIALTAVTFVPVFLKTASLGYGIGTGLCDLAMLVCASIFFTERNRSNARRLFFASIIYLPIYLGLMVFTKN
jgi:protoheme IX farnesyltransferase